ncbi:MAG: outer membrane beta-barrel protein [Chitinophagales bacterium]
MKRILTLGMMVCAAMMGFAQSDTTGKQNNVPDTIKVGGMIIIRKSGGGREIVRNRNNNDSTWHRKYNKPSNVSTNWWILDLGFSNFNDQTNYSSAAAQSFAPTSTDETFKLRNWKSRNVNIWFFMQRLNVIEHVVNLKYGLGLELNNYFFDDERVHMLKNPTMIITDPNYAGLHKNKLAADYLTAPIMLNFNFTPHHEKGFGISAGVSGGYLYSSRQKIKEGGHVSKTHDDFDLRKWKLSYVGELLLGPVKLYGSYATKSMWEKGLDQTPYTVGFRISNW